MWSQISNQHQPKYRNVCVYLCLCHMSAKEPSIEVAMKEVISSCLFPAALTIALETLPL